MKTIAFIGLGLIGGSIARSIRMYHPGDRILAYNRSKDRLARALSENVIDGTLEKEDDRFGQCDYIFLCGPVDFNLEYLKYLKKVISPDCIVTDVGSVKSNIHEAVEKMGMSDHFIGGHPMAGSEKSGFENSHERLLENAYYIITPGSGVPKEKVEEFKAYVKSLGALPLMLSPKEHDFATAGVSHLPHIIASSLVNLVKDLDDSQQHMKQLAAGGFRDITRVASSSPVMWEQICAENGENICTVMTDYIESLTAIRDKIARKEKGAIHSMFVSSRDYRDSIDATVKGILLNIYMLYIDIEDEPGAIATIATILAMHQISIKNIGIIHNREFEQGVLKIEFYEAPAMEHAKALLKKRNYFVYER